jgi:hypothetical protein
MRIAATGRLVWALSVALSAACGGNVPMRVGESPTGAPAVGSQRKAITIALQAEVNGLAGGINQTAINNNPSRFFHEFVNSYGTSSCRA